MNNDQGLNTEIFQLSSEKKFENPEEEEESRFWGEEYDDWWPLWEEDWSQSDQERWEKEMERLWEEEKSWREAGEEEEKVENRFWKKNFWWKKKTKNDQEGSDFFFKLYCNTRSPCSSTAHSSLSNEGTSSRKGRFTISVKSLQATAWKVILWCKKRLCS